MGELAEFKFTEIFFYDVNRSYSSPNVRLVLPLGKGTYSFLLSHLSKLHPNVRITGVSYKCHKRGGDDNAQ